VSGTPPVLKLNAHFQIPVRSSMPKSSYEVLSTLQVFSAALISHYTNLRALTSRRAQFEALKSCRKSLASAVLIPAIYVKLSNILNSRHSSKRSASSWSKDLLKLSFHGIEKVPSQPQTLTSLSRSEGDLNQESQNEVHPTLSVPVEKCLHQCQQAST
jgi:mediator of RNA polymerase II transcription subunit 14